MKIALIHYKIGWKGGLETRLVNYAQTFLAMGHQVSIICASIDSSVTLPHEVEIIQLKPGWVLKPYRPLAFDRKVRSFLSKESFDFILSLGRTYSPHAVIVPANHIGYMKGMGIKKVHFKDRLDIRMDRKAYQDAKVILAASEMMREELIAFYQVDPAKIHILFPPLDTEVFHSGLRAEREKLRQGFGMDKGKTVFAFVSTGHKRKGLPLLLEIFSQLKEEPYELLVAGSAKKLTESAPSNVRFIGFQKNPAALFTAADFTIHPALYEPFGQIISESLACGTPVLVSNMVGAKEIMSEKDGVVVHNFDPESWLETIRNLDRNQFAPTPEFVSKFALSKEDHVTRILQIWDKYGSI